MILRRRNLIDPIADKLRDEGARPIAEQLEEYGEMPSAKGSGAMHIHATLRYLENFFAGEKIATVSKFAPPQRTG